MSQLWRDRCCMPETVGEVNSALELTMGESARVCVCYASEANTCGVRYRAYADMLYLGSTAYRTAVAETEVVAAQLRSHLARTEARAASTLDCLRRLEKVLLRLDGDVKSKGVARSMQNEFEHVLGTKGPSHLHACAHAQPLWATRCGAGTMLEASAWLANATETWRRS